MFAATFFSAIFICGIAAVLLFVDWNTHAYSACQLNLPPNTVSMKVYADNASCDQLPTSFSGYVSTTFSDIPDGSSVLNNTSYAGLCAGLEGYVLDFTSSNATYQVQLLSSLDNPTFAGRPWDKINYILNHTSQYNWLDVQTAIWQLMYPNTSESPYGCNVNQTNVQNIVADANANGGGFVPGNDNLFAIIVSPLSCAGNSSNYCCYPPDCTHLPLQLLFTAATCSASYTVLPSAGGGGSIDPSTQQTVNHNATTSFTVTPDAGYHAVMSGTCGGNLVGSTYTTNPVTADCKVTASFAIDTHTVTPSAGAHGTINPSTAQTVNYNATPSFTVTANAGYLAVMSGTCGGTLDGNTYTTNPITADCTVNASFAVAAPLTITTASLPTGTVLVPYSQALTATG